MPGGSTVEFAPLPPRRRPQSHPEHAEDDLRRSLNSAAVQITAVWLPTSPFHQLDLASPSFRPSGTPPRTGVGRRGDIPSVVVSANGSSRPGATVSRVVLVGGDHVEVGPSPNSSLRAGAASKRRSRALRTAAARLIGAPSRSCSYCPRVSSFASCPSRSVPRRPSPPGACPWDRERPSSPGPTKVWLGGGVVRRRSRVLARFAQARSRGRLGQREPAVSPGVVDIDQPGVLRQQARRAVLKKTSQPIGAGIDQFGPLRAIAGKIRLTQPAERAVETRRGLPERVSGHQPPPTHKRRAGEVRVAQGGAGRSSRRRGASRTSERTFGKRLTWFRGRGQQ